MGYFEAANYCERREYTEGEPKRLMPESLYIDELYMLMVALKARRDSQQAVKFPSRVLQVGKGDDGLHRVKFDVLNVDLQRFITLDGTFVDGYWSRGIGIVRIDGVRAQSAYFRGYGDDLDGELQQIADSVDAYQSA